MFFVRRTAGLVLPWLRSPERGRARVTPHSGECSYGEIICCRSPYFGVRWLSAQRAIHSPSQGQRPWNRGRFVIEAQRAGRSSPLRSIPNIPFINLNFVFDAQLPKLILKRAADMMLGLTIHIIHRLAPDRLAHRKRSVSFLPRKGRDTVWSLLGPLGCFRFDVFHQLGNGHRARQTAHDVNVIDPPARAKWNATRLLDVMAEHSEHLIAKVVALEVGAAVFGAEDEVQPDAGK